MLESHPAIRTAQGRTSPVPILIGRSSNVLLKCTAGRNTAKMEDVDSSDILARMEIGTRSAMLQMRVNPGVKRVSEAIFRRIGLTMTDAMDLFLRRVIVDERIPFDIVALDDEVIERIEAAESAVASEVASKSARSNQQRQKVGSKGG